ncbi:MAG: glycosyltransferase family 2 protein [Phocaeicola sp.]
MRIKLALVSPCYNEEEVLEDSVVQLTKLFDELIAKDKITPDSFVLFVNDGSKDQTWSLIEQLHRTNPFVKGMNLGNNVGHQNAIMAGMMQAKAWSDAVITIDADLQDDLNAIEQMIDAYSQGYDVVYGVKVSRTADPLLKRLSAVSFYKLQERMAVKSVYNHADFRFMSARALEQLSLYKEKNLYLRGIIPLLGFPSTTVDDVISERSAGTSKYTLSKMLGLAIDGITSFSTKPLSIILSAGIIFLFICLLIGLYVLYSLVTGSAEHGWASLILSIWFVGGVVILSIGVVGLYVGRIYTEVKQRPLYSVEKVLYNETTT